MGPEVKEVSAQIPALQQLSMNQLWWCTLKIPALWKTEAEGLQAQNQTE